VTLQPASAAPRVPSDAQIYVKKFLNEEKKEKLTQEIEESGVEKKHRLATLNKLAREALADESEDVRRQVEEEKERLRMERKTVLEVERGMLEEKPAEEYSNHERLV
jgi:uncharacterized protein YcbK (DUF882 family)